VELSQEEAEFLRSQRIGRLATVSRDGWPHVMPVMYELADDGSLEFDADGVKLRNIEASGRAALVVDGMGPKRGIALQGTCEVIGHERARLLPGRRFSWGLEPA